MTEQLSFQIENGGLIPTSPLQMTVKTISVFGACRLNKDWHSRLPIIDWSNVVRNTHYVCYGASYDNHWFAVAIWSDPVARNRMTMGESILELRRMAICDNAPRYTASWMLGVMKRLIKRNIPDIKKLISYQDAEVHTGTIYKAAGWIPETITKGHSWSHSTRKRNPEQTIADKVRWATVIN